VTRSGTCRDFAIAVWLPLLWTLAACGAPATATPTLIARAHPTMGGEVRVTVWTADETPALAAISAVFAEFDRLDALLSVWMPQSDVVRINAAAGGAPVPVSADTLAVIRAGLEASRLTGGAFDMTFGALAEIWKFDHDQDDRVPGDAEIAARLPRVDYRAVRVDDGGGAVALTRAGVRLHLGGIGKGYAVDRGAALLRARGLHDFMIQAGGDLYVAGQPGERPWRLGINDPRGRPDESFATIELRDRTLSTSGDYERFFIQDGERYHHLLDPTTGRPARGCRSVSIVAPTALQADALSTGVFILGPETGMALVERLADVEAVIVTADTRVLVSTGLQGRINLVRPLVHSTP
jgi:thiamine biosynthesis lipoprotein